MTLTQGSRLGAYQIVAPIGAGGMGEVFRARDTKLSRDVAIKVLPAAVALDKERVARFKREAQILASLNHPNIAAIHGLEEDTPTGTVALVMELVEGEDVSERLRRGALPVDEAIGIAKQIAGALEEAHEHGIIHRDLKPANVKVTSDGKVKVLDFGLAKAMEGETGGTEDAASLSHSPTMTRGTEAGVILGTAAYMSPEQARGKKVDKRADIWSFGVVLYEMLTGKRLFDGETVSDTLAAVLTRDPDWSGLPKSTPSRVHELLRRCLERNAKARLRDIGEAALVLAAPNAPVSFRETSPDARGSTDVITPRRFGTFPLMLILLAMVGAIALVTRQKKPAASPVIRVSIAIPPGHLLAGGAPAITKDGKRVAYITRDPEGVTRLYVRALDSFASVFIKGSEGAAQPFFSPAGDRVGFFAHGKLLVASASADGAPPAAIANASSVTYGGTWCGANTIVYVPNIGSGLTRVGDTGGTPLEITHPAPSTALGYAPRMAPVPAGLQIDPVHDLRRTESEFDHARDSHRGRKTRNANDEQWRRNSYRLRARPARGRAGRHRGGVRSREFQALHSRARRSRWRGPVGIGLERVVCRFGQRNGRLRSGRPEDGHHCVVRSLGTQDAGHDDAGPRQRPRDQSGWKQSRHRRIGERPLARRPASGNPEPDHR